MIFLITALLLLLNTQIIPTQAMELTPTSSEDQNNLFKKNLYVLARYGHLQTMFKNFQNGFENLGHSNNLFWLKNICLEAKYITDIPQDIDRLVRSIKVYLQHKQYNLETDYNILADDQEIDIHCLNMKHNYIQHVSAQIGCLITLRSLSFAHNELTSIHENITQLTNLISLDLSENNHLSISAALGEKLVALPKLDQKSKDGIRKYIKESQI